MTQQKKLLEPYQSGKMGLGEGVGLGFALLTPRLFLTQPAINLDSAASLAWLVPLIGGGSTLIAFLMVAYVLTRFPGHDALNVSHLLLGRWLGTATGLYFIGYFFLDGVLLLRQFAENTLITALPMLEFRLAIAVYILMATLLAIKGVEGLGRASYLLIPLGVLPLLLVLLLLGPFYNFDHLFPWQGTGFSQIISSTLLAAGINGGIWALLFLAIPLQNAATLRSAAYFAVGGSKLLWALCNLVFTLVLGHAVGREKILPFFEMARLVYLSRYIQRIEALFILLWVIYGLLGIAADLFMTCYILGRLFGLPAIRPIIPAVALSMAYVSMIPEDVNSVILLNNNFITLYGSAAIYVFPVLLVAACLYKTRRRNHPPCAAE